MYDQREKAQRDYEWAISGAREEGREEGKLAGRIQTLQELLGDRVLTDSELLSVGKETLQADLQSLQDRLRTRNA